MRLTLLIHIGLLIQLLSHSAFGLVLSPLELAHGDGHLYLPSVDDPSTLRNKSFFAIRLVNRPNAQHISGQAILALLTKAMFNASHHSLDETTTSFAFKLNNTLAIRPLRPPAVPIIATIAFNATKFASETPYLLTYERIMKTMSGLATAYAWRRDINNLVELDVDLEYANPWPTNIVTIAHGSIVSELPANISHPLSVDRL